MYLWSELLTTFQTIVKLYNSTQMVYKRLGIKRIAMKSLKKELCTTALYAKNLSQAKATQRDDRIGLSVRVLKIMIVCLFNQRGPESPERA